MSNSGFGGFGQNQKKDVISKQSNSDNGFGHLNQRITILLTEEEKRKFNEIAGKGNGSRIGRELVLRYIKESGF